MYLSNSKRQIYISISIEEKMNSRLTLCMTLHIKGDKEFKNFNLKTEGDKNFDVLNQYQILQIKDWTFNRKIVATITNNLLKYVLITCIYRSMIEEVPTKNSQRSNFNNNKKSMTITMMTIYVLALDNHRYIDEHLCVSL